MANTLLNQEGKNSIKTEVNPKNEINGDNNFLVRLWHKAWGSSKFFYERSYKKVHKTNYFNSTVNINHIYNGSPINQNKKLPTED